VLETVCDGLDKNYVYFSNLTNKQVIRTRRGVLYFEAWGTHPVTVLLNPLTPELNPSAQRCLARFFTRDFAS
jgi:hypothetical protein